MATHEAQPATDAGTRRVAVIMRSKNEQPYTAQTLEGLFSQSFQDFTLYNVDSGSTDGTLEVVKRFNPCPENIVEIAPEDYVPGRVLNHMIARATEPVIVLLNADCVPIGQNWLEALLSPLLQDSADAVTSRQVARPDARFIVRYDLDRAFDATAKAAKRRHVFFSAAACALKREWWDRVKFPETGWGEDFVWAVTAKKQGARFALAADSVVEHSHNYSLTTLYRRECGHGIVHCQTLNEPPSLLRQGLVCSKHIVRDLIHAVSNGRFLTIPYNVAYRITFHWALHQGHCAGRNANAVPRKFFRE